MDKRSRFVAILAALLFLAALAGYLTPRTEPEVPRKVLLRNNAGAVVFNHAAHEGYDIDCQTCHHATKAPDKEVPCTRCHPAEFDDEFRRNHIDWFEGKATCATCHHLEWDKPIFDHTLHEEVADCAACHHMDEVNPRPADCRECHGGEASGPMPSLRDAVHPKCRSCHADMFEEQLAGCSNCHSHKDMLKQDMRNPADCSDCHDKPNEKLVPTEKEAFHGQCMGCHEKQGKGPWRADEEVRECGQCHLPEK